MAVAIHRLEIDSSKSLIEQPESGHNRWHPGIEPRTHVKTGVRVIIETRDAFDGQLTEANPAQLKSVNPGRVHPLTGPVYIEGAEPGDLLEVHILEVEAAPTGFTMIGPNFGFLRDEFTTPFVAGWRIVDGYAESPQVPGVRIAAGAFPGTLGVAPSRELMRIVNERERVLAAKGGSVMLPDESGAVPADRSIALDALRTIPPRENGGNVDIKQLTRGARVYIPVWEKGALFSIGDAHFAQGDSECCGSAIEMRAAFHLEFHLRKGEAARRKLRDIGFARDSYFAPPELAAPRRMHATTGTSITPDGVNHSGDATLAARNALRHMIEYLQERGYSREQAYIICSVAVDLRISQLVDVPNFTVSALLPLDIFV
jgi:formamidase